MKILHILCHMGGGVGKAISELVINDTSNEHILLLLEKPIDKKYINKINNTKILISNQIEEFKNCINFIDIIQIEWWNHPLLLKFLNELEDVNKPVITWTHISINEFFDLPKIIKKNSDKIILTNHSDYINISKRNSKDKYDFISSATGFRTKIIKKNEKKYKYFYAGTLDYAKLHPEYIKMINLIIDINPNFEIKMYGDFNKKFNDEIQKNKNIKYLGYCQDIKKILKLNDFILYILNPSHYGTAENVLIEAMSFGVIPIVMNNYCEKNIIKHNFNGFIVENINEVPYLINQINSGSYNIKEISINCKNFVEKNYNIKNNVIKFNNIYKEIINNAKNNNKIFINKFGKSIWDIYVSCIKNKNFNIDRKMKINTIIKYQNLLKSNTKGSPSHFIKVFGGDKELINLINTLNEKYD